MLRLALAQHDFAAGAVADNAAGVRRLWAEACAGGASLTVFPESALSGVLPGGLLDSPDLAASCEAQLHTLAAEADGGAAAFGVPRRRHDGAWVHGAVWVSSPKSPKSPRRADKQAGDESGQDRRFTRGETARVVEIEGVRVALLVGRDLEDDAMVAQAARADAALIVVMAAWPWEQGVTAAREALLARQARASGCAIAWLNLVGGHEDLLFDGGSMLVQPDGHIVARAPAFTDTLLSCRFEPDTRTLQALDWPSIDHPEPQAVLHAGLIRGIRDYVGKSGFTDVVMGLSGGIDSALSVTLAVDALGPGHVTAVMLPSRFTSRVSLDGARAEAEALGIAYHVVPIEASFEAMLSSLQPVFADKAPDTTEENLQARIRGTLLMALSNKHGKLLLASGNKSELAVGYCTLYGDMCGAYAPLGDIYKTEVYALARWRNRHHPAGARGPAGEVIPQAVIERPPSAELSAGQTDQDSLPPYEQLDDIIARFVERDQSRAAIVAAGHDAETVDRVIHLVLANAFKRRQAAPGPRVHRHAFGVHGRCYPTHGALP